MERFWSKVDKGADCWMWMRHLSKDGYGRFKLDGKEREAHRVAYELTVGAIPTGLEIDHLCRNRACVNPEHLEAVPKQVNILRGYGRGAIEARLTHCAFGHELSDDNLVQASLRRGRRRCRICANAYARTWQKNKRINGKTESSTSQCIT